MVLHLRKCGLFPVEEDCAENEASHRPSSITEGGVRFASLDGGSRHPSQSYKTLSARPHSFSCFSGFFRIQTQTSETLREKMGLPLLLCELFIMVFLDNKGWGDCSLTQWNPREGSGELSIVNQQETRFSHSHSHLTLILFGFSHLTMILFVFSYLTFILFGFSYLVLVLFGCWKHALYFFPCRKQWTQE